VLGQADAMIEALDHELGRLVDALDDRTTLIVTSDNGTAGEFVRPPADPLRAKGSFYAGGTHVPLLMVGPTIEPGVTDVLAHVTDVFPTVLDLAGIDAADLGLDLDGVSLLPVLRGEAPARRCVIVEEFGPNGVRRDPARASLAVIEQGHTLVRGADGREELYVRDPMAPVEGPDLLASGDLDHAANAALRRLRRWASERVEP
jgi:choline-sulfatase